MPSQERPAIGAGQLAIRISSFEPAIPTDDDTLVVQGTITSTATVPVTDVAAVLRVSPTPLGNREEIPEVLAGLGDRTGEPVAGTRVEVADQLAPGRSRTFRLEVEVDDLDLTTVGVYVVGAEALGSTGDGVLRQDLDRTFLPWWPEDTTAQPLLLTTLWPLLAELPQDVEGVLLDDGSAVEMSPGGRLATLLAAAAAQPGAVSPVVDPLTVALAADLADGYEVLGADGTPTAGTRAGEVARWVETLRGAVGDARADPVAMVAGQADLVAARRGRAFGALLGQRELIDDTTAAVLGQSLPQRLALLPGGAADRATLRALARNDVPAGVLADSAVPITTPTFFTPSGSVRLATGAGVLPILLTDSGLGAALAMPLDAPEQVTLARQRLLAESLTTVTELPDSQRLLLMAPESTWSPSAAGAAMVVQTVASTPWLTPTTIEEALTREPSSVGRELAEYTDAQRALELPPEHVAQVRRQYGGLRSYAQVVSDPQDVPTVSRTAPSRGLAGTWRADAATREALADRVTAQVEAMTESVRIVSSGSITVSGAAGTIPVTVENTGTVPVTVGLTMTSTPPQLFEADPVPAFQIDPERRTSVEVTAQVAAAEPITVTVQLTTAGGAPFGEPGELTVQSSAYANAARVLVRAALAALALAVVVHGVRRARRRRRAGQDVPEPEAQPSEVAGG